MVRALQRSPLPILNQIQSSKSLNARDVDPEDLYPAYNLSTPIDHFHNDSTYEPHSNGSFNLRYWFDAQYYKPGGPVIVLSAGETSGVGRLPFLQKGIVAQLAQATNGLGVILEHRYYGTSFPVPDLTTENMRFLTTDQALADTAYFAQHVKFAGLEDIDLTSATTAYIAYGGSYAGAFVAFLRKLYPDVYWGAISSSGVTEAIYDYWQYFDAARIYGPPACVETTQKLTNVVDNILIGKNDTKYPEQLKAAFGLPNVTHTGDFAGAINWGIYGLQSLNWDPAESSNSFFEYCDIVSNDTLVYNSTESLTGQVQEFISVGGWGNESDVLTTRMLNYIGYVRSTAVARCDSADQDECFGTVDASYYDEFDISQTWRAWPYQYCTQWGYLQSGSGVPDDQLPLISRTIDITYSSTICRQAFNITKPSNVEAINKYGGFGISYPRLAIIDGEWDPWRAATPHAIGQPERVSTVDEPFLLIDKAVHHWDENGLFPNQTTPELPPPAVVEAQEAIREFVKAWLQDWKDEGTDYEV
ncbi:peptidase S28 [Pseudomassariella vexata]|uniref:Peptidase S28 n=1 Tax=Pseudomassariella vexata TaxID=1141098 RepID=A0A1Y2EHE6_9PEZI|nr:peptidase S28 [Pseudomassariella vexata]ORY70991.1 peptidase S28 [Pseudomassariella vexata]